MKPSGRRTFFCVAPYRLAEGMPLSDALRGSLSGQGFAYQCAFRFSALASPLVSVWLSPSASYQNRVMFTEAVTRAAEVCRRQMCMGPRENYEVEKYDNAVLGNFAGTVLFGIIANDVRKDAGMLQAQFAGAAPNVGEHHYASPSDCLPWSTRNGFFEIGDPASFDVISEACSVLAQE